MMEITDELLDRFLDGDASRDEATLLHDWLLLPANMVRFAERVEIHGDLRRSLHRRSIQQELLTACGENDTSPNVFADRVEPARRRYKRPTFVLFAGVLATAAVLMIAFLRPDETTLPEPPDAVIATLAYESHALWSDRERLAGDAIAPCILRLEVGIVRLDFSNGAAVTLQGPAEFEVMSAIHTRLHRGILTASIPESAIGFEVETPAIDVVDLGTAFGVSVGFDGETDVCVFEGEVEVRRAGNDGGVQLLSEGNAVRSTIQSSEIELVAYETNKFEDAWPVNSGVLRATGLMKFVAPGPEFVPGRFEDNERILVFLERSGVVPTADFAVDLVDPGQYQRIHRNEQHPVRAGRRIRSYLLQLDPVGKLDRDASDKPRVISQVTFDSTIIGLIASSKKLDATDELLGHPRGNYVKTRRGIEPPRSTDPPDSGRDIVVLSTDRRTLSLDLSAGTAVDQIRVVVDELNLNRERLTAHK